MNDWLIHGITALAAIGASLLGAFTGGGSILIMLPLLLFLVPAPYISIIVVSKIMSTVMLAVSTRIHFKKTTLKPKFLILITIFGLLGTSLGTYLLQYSIDEKLFKNILALLLIGSSFYLSIEQRRKKKEEREKPLTKKILTETALFCFFTGILNGIAGGTGLLNLFYLNTRLRIPFMQSVAYTMFSYLIINGLQTGYLASKILFDHTLAVIVILGAIIGGALGTRLQYIKGHETVRKGVIVMMSIIGVEMIIS